MKNLITVFLVFFIISPVHASMESLKKQGYDEDVIEKISDGIEKGINFDRNKLIFTYYCGGGAICGGIYIPDSVYIVNLPDNYKIDDERKEFSLSYSKDSNKVCVSGVSAYDDSVYNNKCYVLKSNSLLDSK